jgi:hypothetical protein
MVVIASIAHLQGRWIATDGAEIRVDHGQVIRNGIPTTQKLEESEGTVYWASWMLVENHASWMLWFRPKSNPSARIAWIRHDVSDLCQSAAKTSASSTSPISTDLSRFRSRRTVLRPPARHTKPKVLIFLHH